MSVFHSKYSVSGKENISCFSLPGLFWNTLLTLKREWELEYKDSCIHMEANKHCEMFWSTSKTKQNKKKFVHVAEQTQKTPFSFPDKADHSWKNIQSTLTG